jgi:chromosome segregation ATPase
MQPLLAKDSEFFAKENIPAKPSLWNQAGPFLLLSAFAILIFKCASFFSWLLLTAIAGYAANLFWKKRGFYLSLMSLAAVSIFTIQSGVDPFWSSLLSTSIALSWLLIFLGKQESEAFILDREEKIKTLKENQRLLEKQLREVKASLSEENKENVAERERFNRLYAQMTLELSQAKHSLEISEKERDKLNERCEILSQDTFAYKQKEIAFQHSLEDAQSQLLKLKNQQLVELDKENKPVSTNIIPQEETDLQEKARVEQVQHQYTLLREQFDEKSEALDQARKELFRVENEFLALQKMHQENALEIFDEDRFLMKDLKRLEEECADLEIQVSALQELVSALLSPKKRTVRSRESMENQERLPLLIQEKIDQTISSDSTSEMI